jgi:valyl-tRNA synthetase
MKKEIIKENLVSNYPDKISRFEDKNPLIASTMRSVLGIFPIGTLVTEFCVDSLARKKQTRINNFITYFGEFLETNNSNGKVFQDFNKDEFEDIFEAILLKIHRTRTESKRKIFAKILADSLCFEKNNFDFIETFLDLIDKLNTKQLEILEYYSSENTEKTPILKKITEIQSKIKDKHLGSDKIQKLKLEKEKLEKLLQEITQTTIKKNFEIDKTSLSYHKQDLVSKSLLQDFGLSTFDATPYIYLEITEFGQEFISYIKN